MPRTRPLVGVLALGLLVSSAGVRAESLADELLRRSGLDQQIESVKQQVSSGIAMQGSGLSPELSAILERVVEREYAASALKQRVKARLGDRIDPDRAQAALRWLESPLGRRITAAESTAAGPDVALQMQAYAASLGSAGPRPERAALLDRLDVASGATDMTVDVALATSLAVVIAMDSSSRSPRETESLRAMVATQRDQMRPPIAEFTHGVFLFTYRDVSDADLEQYIAFLQSDTGSWYNETLGAAFAGALADAAFEMAASLRQELDAARASESL